MRIVKAILAGKREQVVGLYKEYRTKIEACEAAIEESLKTLEPDPLSELPPVRGSKPVKKKSESYCYDTSLNGAAIGSSPSDANAAKIGSNHRTSCDTKKAFSH